MASITQAQRTLLLKTPLGADVLLLLGFSGTESLSRLFSYQLDLASANDAIAAKNIVGKPVTWSVTRFDQNPRYFSGIVSRFVAGALNRRKLRTYRAEVVPWPWLLTRTTDCRIFQNLNTPDIITKIFSDFGFSDYKLELKGSFPKREYCVQYRETAFNFISRLMEHEGIFYFFRHEDGKHTMVLANATSSYADCPESQVEYSPGSLAPNHVQSWEHHYEFRSGKWSRTDYNFETPSTSLLTSTSTVIDLPDAPKYEIFDYPGEYFVKGDGDPVTKVRMEEEEAGYNVVNAASQCCTFTPCGKFTLKKHDVAAENGDYVITSIRHSATEASYGSTANGATYNNVFTCIPASVLYRPPRATPKPMVQGVQTAVVTGPGGEEIYVDKYGRVKVQFFWDRQGKKDDKSSCWIRVAEQWAGKNWGFVCNPRIGQEVIVDFLEGDPDRPLDHGPRVQRRADAPLRPARQHDPERHQVAEQQGGIAGQLQRAPLRGPQGLGDGHAPRREGPDDRGRARRVPLGRPRPHQDHRPRRDHPRQARPDRDRRQQRDDHHPRQPHRDRGQGRDDHHPRQPHRGGGQGRDDHDPRQPHRDRRQEREHHDPRRPDRDGR